MQNVGRTNWSAFSGTPPVDGSHVINIPFDVTATTFSVRAVSSTPELRAQDPFSRRRCAVLGSADAEIAVRVVRA